MGKINIHNYEKYAIDYLEGNLDIETRKEFELFLSENPQVAEELNDIETITLSRPNITFENKDFLKKSEIEDISYVEYLIISEIEGLATDKEKQELKELIESDSRIKLLYKQFLNTKLSPETVIFEDKNKLKKTKVVVMPSLLTIAVAASLILLFWIFGRTNNQQNAIFAKMTDFDLISTNNLQKQKESLLAKMPVIDSISKKNIIALNNTHSNINHIIHSNNQTQPTDTFYVQENIFVENDNIAPKQIRILEALPEPDIKYLKISNQNLVVDKGVIKPVKLANKVIDVYEYATENTDLNMKICYNKEDKSLCLAYKDKDYVVVFE